MSTTPIIQNLLTLCHDYGKELASNFLEGESAIGGTMDDELTEFLARRDLSWDSLTTEEQDALRDEALTSFMTENARRLGKVTETPSPASPAGSVAVEVGLVEEATQALEAVKKALEEGTVIGVEPKSYHKTCLHYNEVQKVLSVLSRLGSLRERIGKSEGPSTACSAGSGPAGADVLPLGEITTGRDIFCKDISGHAFWIESRPIYNEVRISDMVFSKEQTKSLISHLQQWLLTGSFDLTTKEESK